MIKRLRRQLITSIMLAVILVFVVIMSMVNIANHLSHEQESDNLLATLAESGGVFKKPEPTPTPTPEPTPTPTPSPEPTETATPLESPAVTTPWAQPIPTQDPWGQGKGGGKGPNGGHWGNIPKWAWGGPQTTSTPSPEPTPEPTPTPTPTPTPLPAPRFFDRAPTVETPYETRYFSVSFEENGKLAAVDTSKIAAVSTSQSVKMAKELLAQASTSGYYGNYKYLADKTDGQTLYIFLDCTKNIQSERQLLLISILVSVVGIIVVFIFVVLLSPKMIRPVAESYEKQKQFITNAGHEIKTPLAVIDSCTDVIELEQGESKWTSGIRSQVQRLGALTAELTSLARLDEQTELPKEEFSLSEQVTDVLTSFYLLAEQQGLTLEADVQPEISYTGNAPMLEELCSILLDNAIKYTTPGGTIRVSLKRKGRRVLITCENPAAGLTQGSQSHLFDRFYRGDISRGGNQPGYGIGLSMAEAIVTAHHGKIEADSPDGEQFIISAQL